MKRLLAIFASVVLSAAASASEAVDEIDQLTVDQVKHGAARCNEVVQMLPKFRDGVILGSSRSMRYEGPGVDKDDFVTVTTLTFTHRYGGDRIHAARCFFIWSNYAEFGATPARVTIDGRALNNSTLSKVQDRLLEPFFQRHSKQLRSLKDATRRLLSPGKSIRK